MRNNTYLFIAICILSGCSSTDVVNHPLSILLVDKPEEGKVELIYKNTSKRTVCIEAESWPNQTGKVHYAADQVFLIIDKKRYPIKDFNTGYCLYGCPPIKVKGGDSIKGEIPYEDFNLPKEQINKPKKLDYVLTAYGSCRRFMPKRLPNY